MTLTVWLELISSIIAARRALAGAGRAGHQHEPALFLGNSLQDGGSVSSGMVATRKGITRNVIPMVPRCWNALQRKRPRPATLRQIHLVAVLEFLAQRGGQDSSRDRDHFVVVDAAVLATGVSSPRTRIINCRPSDEDRTRRALRRP